MTQIWDKKGDKVCPLCKKGKAQLYGDNKNGTYVEACWYCLYDK